MSGDPESRATPSTRAVADPARPWADLLGGISLGLLLGLLIGLSATPVVSIVITALVALLAGLFGLSEKIGPDLSAASVRRLSAFGLAAAIAAPAGVWIRTHEILGPSIEEQKASLRAIGYSDGSAEQKDMLRYLRYGLLPPGVAAPPPRPLPLLYGTSAGLCDDLSRTQAAADVVLLLSQGDAQNRRLAETIKGLPGDRQAAAADFAKQFLCSGN
jgi:hypothetical protein